MERFLEMSREEFNATLCDMKAKELHSLVEVLGLEIRGYKKMRKVDLCVAIFQGWESLKASAATVEEEVASAPVAEPVKVITISRNAVIKAFESKYCKWTVDMPKQEEAEIEPAIAQDEPTAPTTATTTAPKEEAEKKEEKKATAKTTKDLSALRAQLLGMASEYFTLEEKTSYTSVKLGKKCVMEIYKGKRAFQIAISNKYLFEDYINQADSIKKFPNDCYYKVTEDSFSKVKEIVADALANIRNAFPDKVNNNSISTQQSIIDNDTTAVAEA